MLAVRNITKFSEVDTGDGELKGVTAEFGKRGLVFLRGKNASGVVMLAKILGGLDAPTSGRVIYDGVTVDFSSESGRNGYRNAHIGFVSGTDSLIDYYRVGKNVSLASEGRTGKIAADQALRQVGLTDGYGGTLSGARSRTLSPLQKQLTVIARALVKNPSVMIAVHPVRGLGKKDAEEIYGLLKTLSKDRLVILTAEDEDVCHRYGDRVFEIDGGCMVSSSVITVRINGVVTDSADGGSTKSATPRRGLLSARRIFALSAGGFAHYIILLVLAVAFTMLPMGFLGLSFAVMNADRYDTELSYMTNKGCSLIGINVSGGRLDDAQIKAVKDFNGGVQPINVISRNEIGVNVRLLSTITEYIGDLPEYEYYSYEDIALAPFSAFAELDPDTGETDALLNPDARFTDKTVCRLPRTFNEIAITDLRADIFIKYGYKEADGSVTHIQTPDGLIGKEIGGFKITGVYSTEHDKSAFEDFTEKYYDSRGYSFYNNYAFGAKSSIINYGFLCKGYYFDWVGKETTGRVLVKLTGDFNKDRAFVERVRHANADQYKNSYIYLRSPYSDCVSDMLGLMSLDILLFIIDTILFLPFALLAVASYLTCCLGVRKKEYELLRTMGASRRRLWLIPILHFLMFTAVCFIFSYVAVVIGASAINVANGVIFYNTGPATAVLMFVSSFAVSALAAVFPAIRMARSKPFKNDFT